MTREEAIKIFNTVLLFGSCDCQKEEIEESLKMAINALEMVEKFEKAQIITCGRLNGRTYAYKCGLEDGKRKALEQEPRWIPVSERLPEKNVEVLATTEWGAVTIAEMYGAYDWLIREGTYNADTDEIAAWMPLPEPYKAESEDKEC